MGPRVPGQVGLGANLVAVTWPSLSGVGHCLVHWLPLPILASFPGVLGGEGENDHFDTYADALWVWGLQLLAIGLPWPLGPRRRAFSKDVLAGHASSLGSLLPMV